MESLTAWFAGRLPDGWFTAAPEVTVDREEILVVGTVLEPAYPDGADDAARRAAQQARIERFREETRGERIRIAEDAERRTGRKVAWGARCGDERQVFTSLSVPVMTRLRMPERQVLDTLVGAGVAAQPLGRARMVCAPGARPPGRVDPTAAGRAGRGARSARRRPVTFLGVAASPRPRPGRPHRSGWNRRNRFRNSSAPARARRWFVPK